MHLKLHNYFRRRGKKRLIYCSEKKVLNTSQIFTLYNIISIKTVDKKVVHALVIPQSTKKVKNLKFDCVTLIGPFSHAPYQLKK